LPVDDDLDRFVSHVAEEHYQQDFDKGPYQGAAARQGNAPHRGQQIQRSEQDNDRRSTVKQVAERRPFRFPIGRFGTGLSQRAFRVVFGSFAFFCALDVFNDFRLRIGRVEPG